MKGKIGNSQRLFHILESIAEIEKYTTNIGLEEFHENSMMRFASIKQIEIIGEAANYISEMSYYQAAQVKKYNYNSPGSILLFNN